MRLVTGAVPFMSSLSDVDRKEASQPAVREDVPRGHEATVGKTDAVKGWCSVGLDGVCP